jgi:hypothetical protein
MGKYYKRGFLMPIPNISDDPTYITTRSDIIKDAYAMLSVFGVDEHIDNDSYQAANRHLNRIAKRWMAQGYHLWLKEIAYLFLKVGQNTYNLSSSSSDHATLNYVETKLLNDAPIGSNSIIVVDTIGIHENDNIGIIVSGNDLFWTTAFSIVGNTINFPVGVTLPIASSQGARIFAYTTLLPKPLELYSGVRNENGRDVPMDYLSYEEWFELPNKTDTTSTPVSFSYDKQLTSGVIRLWPNPNDCNVIIKFVISREIFNFDVNSNTPDFPQEWHDAIVLNLALRLAFPHRKANDNAYQNLKLEAKEALNDSLGFDNEQNSIYFQPNFRQ